MTENRVHLGKRTRKKPDLLTRVEAMIRFQVEESLAGRARTAEEVQLLEDVRDHLRASEGIEVSLPEPHPSAFASIESLNLPNRVDAGEPEVLEGSFVTDMMMADLGLSDLDLMKAMLERAGKTFNERTGPDGISLFLDFEVVAAFFPDGAFECFRPLEQ